MTNPRKSLLVLITIVIAVLILIFIYSRTQGFIKGPQLESINIQEVQYQDEYSVSLEGTVIYTEELRVNGMVVPLNQRGDFTYLLALNPGRNIIELELHDGFENEVLLDYQIITPISEKIYPPIYTKPQGGN
jgi:hypothetical protein